MALLLFFGCIQADAATLSICRSAGQTSGDRQAEVDLGTATVFADIGPSDPDLQTGDNFLPVRLVTDNPEVVRVSSGCVRVAAHVIYNPRHLPVGPAQRRMYRYVSQDSANDRLNAVPLDRFD